MNYYCENKDYLNDCDDGELCIRKSIVQYIQNRAQKTKKNKKPKSPGWRAWMWRDAEPQMTQPLLNTTQITQTLRAHTLFCD
jgi:hypothetical protein